MDPESGRFEQRISHRARRLRIDVSARRGVVVVVPAGTPEAIVHRFVDHKRDWIRRACERVRARSAAVNAPAGPAVPERLELRALDRTLQVATIPGGHSRVVRVGDTVRVTGAAAPDEVRRRLAGWLRQEARSRLVPRLAELAAEHGLRYRRTMVRGQRTRWASCSARGTISLNYKLLFLPPALVDHVLLHELAHTRHLNHSRHFWDLLARLDPDWRRHHTALSTAGQWLPAWVEMLD